MRYPEMVKPNARHRGPMESMKQSMQIRDASRSVTLLYELFGSVTTKQEALRNDIMTMYNETIPNTLQEQVHDVDSVKGGEL